VQIGIFVVMAGSKAGGPETYEHCLVRCLARISPNDEFHVFCLSDEARASFQCEQDNVIYHVLWPRFRWISIPFSLPVSLASSGVDFFHATFIPPPLARQGFVFTMHCYSNFLHPEFYDSSVLWRLNRSIMSGLRRARTVVCVSQCVRDLVATDFKIPLDRLPVVHNGIDESFRPVPGEMARQLTREKYGISRPYALFVGQIKARKNVLRILEAFHQVRQHGFPDLALVLAGRRSWTSEGIDECIERLELRDHVVEIGHLKLHDLPTLYSASEMLVFPSLWEGFGIPVIEAMACGAPVITSNLSALPEVVGNAGLLVDPYSVDEIADAMLRILSDSLVRDNLRTRGLERAKHFSWERSARETLAAYRGGETCLPQAVAAS
jgi:glycosyltransferase involved in cell wall biosynthesis